MAMRIVAEAARLMGAPRLIPVASAHIDGALYHGDSGTLFAEALVSGGASVRVPATLNVGALDLDGLLARPPAGARARHGPAHDARLRGDGLRRHLDLRALSGRPPARHRHGRGLGRIERRRVLQLRAGRAHQSLRRFPRHRLRRRGPRAGLRPAPRRRTAGPRWWSTRRGCRRRCGARSVLAGARHLVRAGARLGDRRASTGLPASPPRIG